MKSLLKKPRRGTPKYFIQQFVLGFGFLSGLWINIGFDPEDFFWEFFSNTINFWFPNNVLTHWFWIVPSVLLVAALIGTLIYGGLVGLLALGLAFFAGILMPDLLAFILLGSAIVVGIYAVKLKIYHR